MRRTRRPRSFAILPCSLGLLTGPALVATAQDASQLETVAERSNYTETATYDDVMSLARLLDQLGDHVRLDSLGTTNEGRGIPLLIIASPPVATAQEARESGKLIFFAFANIHAGEVCGKEALMMLARELALDADHPLLHDIILLIAPIYNADGNERFAPVAENRPGQVGPERVGQRPNAQGLDLNRDYIKLEAPETRALVALLTEWDPHITIDCHTTNGSHHRYTLTFDAPTNPSGPLEPIEFVRDHLLPTVAARLLERTGYDTFFYGDFNRDHTTWVTYSAQPRYGGPYQGLRGQMSILSEAYSYAPFKDRVLCTLEFVREVAQYAQENRAQILDIHDRARLNTTARGDNPQPDDTIGIRHRIAAAPALAIAKGWEYDDDPARSRRPVPTDRPKDYPVVHLGRFEATRSVSRPYAYLIRPGYDDIIALLRAHGAVVEPLAPDTTARAEEYTIDEIDVAPQNFQGHRTRLLECTAQLVEVTIDDVEGGAADAEHPGDEGEAEAGAGTAAGGAVLIRTAQPLGNLIVYMLEPESEDGLAAWDLFGDRIQKGGHYPILRIAREQDLKTEQD